MPDSPPRKVYLMDNDMVMVFDASGRQIPELQAPYCRTRLSILENADASTRFFFGRYRGTFHEIPAQTWARLAKAAEARHEHD